MRNPRQTTAPARFTGQPESPDPLAGYRELRQLGDFQQTIGDLYQTLTLVIYGGVICAGVLFQGGNALYYFTRARLVRDYVSKTEPWVIELQRSTNSH